MFENAKTAQKKDMSTTGAIGLFSVRQGPQGWQHIVARTAYDGHTAIQLAQRILDRIFTVGPLSIRTQLRMNRMTGDPTTAKSPAARNETGKKFRRHRSGCWRNTECLSAEPYNHHVRGAFNQRKLSDSSKGTLKGSQDWFLVAAQDLVQGLLLSVFCHMVITSNRTLKEKSGTTGEALYICGDLNVVTIAI
jgi:hypothetical protein